MLEISHPLAGLDQLCPGGPEKLLAGWFWKDRMSAQSPESSLVPSKYLDKGHYICETIKNLCGISLY